MTQPNVNLKPGSPLVHYHQAAHSRMNELNLLSLMFRISLAVLFLRNTSLGSQRGLAILKTSALWEDMFSDTRDLTIKLQNLTITHFPLISQRHYHGFIPRFCGVIPRFRHAESLNSPRETTVLGGAVPGDGEMPVLPAPLL